MWEGLKLFLALAMTELEREGCRPTLDCRRIKLFPVVVSLTYMVFRIFTSALLTMHVRRLFLVRLIQPLFQTRGIRTIIPKALWIRAVRSISANCGQPSLPIIEQTRLEPDTGDFALQRLVHSLEHWRNGAQAYFEGSALF